MAEHFAEFFSGIPPQLIVLIIAFLPVVELRGAIPWALAVTDLSWQETLVYALIGNAIPILPILLLLEPVSSYLRKIPIFDKFFNWLFKRTRRRGEKVIQKYKAFGLAVFVGIPLPVTGVWTGAVMAFIFGIPFRLALPALIAGMIFASILVTLASLGVIGFLQAII